jgi:hypothetical protein
VDDRAKGFFIFYKLSDVGGNVARKRKRDRMKEEERMGINNQKEKEKDKRKDGIDCESEVRFRSDLNIVLDFLLY